MQLTVLDKAGNKICLLDDNARLLGSFHVDDGMTIHVRIQEFSLLKKIIFCKIRVNLIFGFLQVTDNCARLDFDQSAADVPKFELTEEKYAEREGLRFK